MSFTRGHNDDRQRVLDATDIVRLVGDHITLRPKGREYVCLCPFHDDHKPSMCVVPHKQIYHCFSCGAGGNSIDFVMNYHKMEFMDALRFLADRAGVELTPRKRSDAGEGAEQSDAPAASRADLIRANSTALGFFRTILRHAEHGASARGVIERRGVSPEMVELFQLGAAPDRWDGLLKTIESKCLPTGWFEQAGLLKPRETGGLYDALRNRLVFPIHDQIGRPIAFGARRIDDEDEPKYLNSPESTLFDKSSTLYGLHQAHRAIQNERTAIVTEGYTDVIACHQAGIHNVVATLGTALTTRHAPILRRVCDQVILLFDADDAGAKAADRAIEVFFAEPVDVKIAILPHGKDPDELFRMEGGVEMFKQAVADADDALEYRFRRLGKRLEGLGLSARTRLIEEDLATLVDLGLNRVAPIRRRLITRRLASLAGTPEQTILETLSGLGARRRARAGEVVDEAPASSDAALLSHAEHALGCLLCNPALRFGFDNGLEDILDPCAYPDGPARMVADALHNRMKLAETIEDAQEPTLADVLTDLDDPEARRVAIRIASETERITDHDEERIREHLAWCVRMKRLRAGDIELNHSAPADVIELLERRRHAHRTLGGDPRTMPRLGSTAG